LTFWKLPGELVRHRAGGGPFEVFRGVDGHDGPGTLSAAAVSMPLTFACPYGLLTKMRWSIPGSWISSTYCEDR